MPIIYSNEYCKFYPYCIHSNYREITCRKGNWIYCYIYQKINISKVNNMNIDFEKIIHHISETYIDGCNDKNCLYCKKYLEVFIKYKFNLLIKEYDNDN